MSILVQLKHAETLSDFAHILHYQPKSLSYILYRMPPSSKYTQFAIPKKGGSSRIIHAPNPRLKALQGRLAEVLTACNMEISPPVVLPPGIKPSVPRSLSHGFTKGRSIITNAWPHKRKRFVFNLDLQDFFQSINFGRVRGYFIKNRNFALSEKISTIIAQIACVDNGLPQGSPCSPLIANMIGHPLDIRLAHLAASNKCTYTRYADDLTFSTNKKDFPASIAFEKEKHEWIIGIELENNILRSGFKINPSKTRMQCRTTQQSVTGLSVNSKVNIRSSYYRSARSMCHHLFKTGKYYIKNKSSSIPISTIFTTSKTAHLEGILSHIYYVKHTSDVMSGYIDRAPTDIEVKKRKFPSHRALYKKLLYFRHFINLDMPIIVCEGKTDNIYLRSAIRSLISEYPTLGNIHEGKLTTKVRFLKHSRIEHDILEISGGSNNLAKFITYYNKTIHSYKYAPLRHPVIVLVDNDSGSGSIFSALRGIKAPFVPSITTTNEFYHACRNLYVIKTPEMGKKEGTCIEDLFDDAVLATKLDGKFFSKDNDLDSLTHYGKLVFADRVIRPSIDTIDFSKFRQLLNRIVSVIKDYKSPS